MATNVNSANTSTASTATTLTGNNTAGPFAIDFAYGTRDDVEVFVDGVLKTETTHYNFSSQFNITFTSGNEPADGAVILFQRNTHLFSSKVFFQDASVLTAANLNELNKQVLHGLQEIISGQAASVIKSSYESNTNTNAFTDAQNTKLSGIEANATADQTASEIRTLVESATDSNVFTDADHSKLNGIEAGATADQTNAEIKTAYEANSDTNAFTDSEKSKLTGIEANATADQTGAEIKTAYEAESNTNAFTDAEKTKLVGIEANADVTDATNVDAAGAIMNSDLDGKGELLVGDGSGDPTALGVGTDGFILKANSSTATGLEWSAAGAGGDVNQNAFSNIAVSGQDTVAADSTTDTFTLVAGTNVTLTTNASNDEITITSTDTNTTYSVGDGGLTQNNFTNALKTKLDGIAPSANVGLTDLVGDTTPQLGGNLDVNGQDIVSVSNGDIDLDPNGSGKIVAKGNATRGSGQIKLNCEQNSHGVILKGPPHSAAADYTLTLPNDDGSANQVLKTDGSGNLSWVDQTTDTNTTYSAGSGLTLTGTTFSVDTLNQDTTGSAATLTTARNIGGVSFDGSANIDLPGVNTAGNQNTTGSAATLTTPRAINGVNFDGSADITVTDSTKLPLTGGTLTGAVTVDAINDTVYAITDSNSATLDPDNGMVQTWTLGGARDISSSGDQLTAGQSMLLVVTPAGNSLTLPSITWAGGSAPTFHASKPTAIEFWKIGSTLYAASIGDLG